MKKPTAQPNNVIIFIAFIILVLGGAGLYTFASQNKPSTESSQQISVVKQEKEPDFSSLNYKDPQEFFPNSLGKYIITSTDKGYKIGKTTDTEYTDESKSAKITKAFQGFYENSEKKDPMYQTRIVYFYFPDIADVDTAESITDALFDTPTLGYQKISLSLPKEIKYWAFYRTVPSEKAKTQFSSDVRLFFPEAHVMIRFNAVGGNTQDEVEEFVTSYVKALLDKNTSFVTKEEVYK